MYAEHLINSYITSGQRKSSAMPERFPELFPGRLKSSAKRSGLKTFKNQWKTVFF